jgi:hypothetical protein
VLPHGVSWKGSIDPIGSNVSYNDFSRTVTWRIGRMAQGAGIESVGPSVAFQVGLIPSITQTGKTLPLLSSIVYTAYDEFARTHITRPSDDVTTAIVSDPIYTYEKGVVER